MFALARGTGASRPCRGLRACAYEALATDALAAPQLGRKGRPQKADGLLALWSDTQPEVRDAHAYQVDEVLHWDDEVPTRLVAFYFVRRRPDLSLDAFRARYHDGHAPVARVQHPGLRRYVQNFVTQVGEGAPHWDAIAQLHFESEETFRERFYRDDRSPAIVAEDIREFADLTTGFALVTLEREPV